MQILYPKSLENVSEKYLKIGHKISQFQYFRVKKACKIDAFDDDDPLLANAWNRYTFLHFTTGDSKQ